MTAPYERFCKNRVAADRSGLRWKGGLGDAAHNKLHGDFRSENPRAPRSVMNEAQLANAPPNRSYTSSLFYPCQLKNVRTVYKIDIVFIYDFDCKRNCIRKKE